MRVYLKILGLVLIGCGIGGSIYFGVQAGADEAYFRAARALEKYPNNVLYQTEFKMAEPRHMLLLMGMWAAAPAGVVLGSLCLGLSTLLTRVLDSSR
jgi:hypothetical protein